MELTERQREIFEFVQGFIREKGYPPSIREVGEHFHIYPRAVFDHLKALERKGYLKRQEAMSRGIELLTFQGERFRGRGEKPGVKEVPILGRVAAGKPTLAVENLEGSIPLPAEWAKGKETFLLKVKGDSMSPYILPGDYVIVRSQPSAENGDVVVTLIGDEATVKRFFKRKGKIELKPDNEHWETIRIEEGAGEIQIMGKVIGVFRKV